jgi:glycosyltransferase involved in cell wall biosynthesis
MPLGITVAESTGWVPAPRVSIVVPTYNNARWIRESLASIVGQTYQDLEVLIVDDASTDASAQIVASFDDPRIRYWRQPSNRGIFPTLQEGIARARGSLIAFYHSDDLYDREIVAREVAYLDEHPEVGAVFAIDRFIDPDGAEYARLELPPEFRGARPLGYAEVLNGVLRYGNVFIRGQTSLVRRSIYNTVGSYDPRYDLRADIDMWLRIAAVAPIAVLDEYLMAYRWGHSNTSARYDRLRREPELTFAVIDAALERCGSAVAEKDALRAYQARRQEDLLIVAANLYTLAEIVAARRTLAAISPARLLSSRRVRRGRLVAFWLLLQLVTRLPRADVLGAAFQQRFARIR